MARRVLSAADLGTEAGQGLLALCRRWTAGGTLTDDGISELQEWLRSNPYSPLQSAAHLRTALAESLEGQAISDFSRSRLYRAIEAVLPKEDREASAASRRRVERKEIRATRRQPDADGWSFEVEGLTKRDGWESVIRYLTKGELLELAVDSTAGRDDGRARLVVRIESSSDYVGVVPGAPARAIQQAMADGWSVEARCAEARVDRWKCDDPDNFEPAVVVLARRRTKQIGSAPPVSSPQASAGSTGAAGGAPTGGRVALGIAVAVVFAIVYSCGR